MRQLRLDVDRLLGEGEVAEAEALMEEKRQYLAEHGYFIRKINQAYFAFHGLYGTAPASSSPIGPKLEELQAAGAVAGRVHTRRVSGHRARPTWTGSSLPSGSATPP